MIQYRIKNLFFCALASCFFSSVKAQVQSAPMSINLTLQQTIDLACDSSLAAFRSQNVYMASYWEYRSFKADRLPSLTLNLTPGQYYRTIIKRYDSTNDIDVYRPQQSYEAYGGLSVSQNFDMLGGTFYLYSNLDYNRNFGDKTYTQYTTVPIRIGYNQDLIGYNSFKWEKKIAPLKYEKAKKQLVYNLEDIACTATSYFFDLAMAQVDYELAKENLHNTDTLYRIGQERFKIAFINQSDLLTLKLDYVNASNTFTNADITLKRAMFTLAAYLNMDKNTRISVRVPNYPKTMEIPTDKALIEAQTNNPDLMGFRQDILEKQQAMDKAKKEAMFNASLNASVGYNQVSSSFSSAYRRPLQQDIVAVTVSIPLIDWGVRRGKYNMARNNLNVSEITAKEGEEEVTKDVMMTVGDFSIQKQLIGSAEEAYEIADKAYAETQNRFVIGKADISTLTLSRQRQQEARRNYITALENYWNSYYKIRKLTLYDFEMNVPITNTIESRMFNL